MRHFRYFTLLLLVSTVEARVKLPAIFGDHMMIQRDQPVHVWGEAEPGEDVTVRWKDRAPVSAKAGATGKWSVMLAPMPAGGPFELEVRGQNTITLSDVIFGDIWVASGQSNMEWPLSRANNAQAEIAAATDGDIRLFKVNKKVSDVPLKDVEGSWQRCSPETARTATAVGYFFARHLREKVKVPVGILESNWGGTPAEAWTSTVALASEPALLPHLQDWARVMAAYPDAQSSYEARRREWEAKRSQNPKEPPPGAPQGPGHAWTPGGLWNAMIAPITPFPIKGVIWYQGESNGGGFRPPLYEKLFETMIQDWRRAWGIGDFPFLFVQLANFKTGRGSDWPLVREAQRRTLSLRNTGMAVTIDIGNPDDIHPTNKQDVGLRLALAARAVAYGESILFSGPAYRAMTAQGAEARVWFDQAKGLKTSDGAEPTGFEIAGPDGAFRPASARIDGETVVLSNADVAFPTAVRYAWADNPRCNLVGGDGLPASPFRSR